MRKKSSASLEFQFSPFEDLTLISSKVTWLEDSMITSIGCCPSRELTKPSSFLFPLPMVASNVKLVDPLMDDAGIPVVVKLQG